MLAYDVLIKASIPRWPFRQLELFPSEYFSLISLVEFIRQFIFGCEWEYSSMICVYWWWWWWWCWWWCWWGWWGWWWSNWAGWCWWDNLICDKKKKTNERSVTLGGNRDWVYDSVIKGLPTLTIQLLHLRNPQLFRKFAVMTFLYFCSPQKKMGLYVGGKPFCMTWYEHIQLHNFSKPRWRESKWLKAILQRWRKAILQRETTREWDIVGYAGKPM